MLRSAAGTVDLSWPYSGGGWEAPSRYICIAGWVCGRDFPGWEGLFAHLRQSALQGCAGLGHVVAAVWQAGVRKEHVADVVALPGLCDASRAILHARCGVFGLCAVLLGRQGPHWLRCTCNISNNRGPQAVSANPPFAVRAAAVTDVGLAAEGSWLLEQCSGKCRHARSNCFGRCAVGCERCALGIWGWAGGFSQSCWL